MLISSFIFLFKRLLENLSGYQKFKKCCDLWEIDFLGCVQPFSNSVVTFFTLEHLDHLKFVLVHPGLDPSLFFSPDGYTKLTQHRLLGCSSLICEATFILCQLLVCIVCISGLCLFFHCSLSMSEPVLYFIFFIF